MSVPNYFLIILIVFLVYTAVYKIAKKEKPFKRAFLVMLCGICTLILTDIIGIFTGVYLPVSMLSITIAACGGIPGVASMMVVCWLL